MRKGRNLYFSFPLLLITGLASILFSCKKIECEAFDTSHPIMNWHFFPDLQQEYTFSDIDSNLISFRKAQDYQSGYEERRCHMCYCHQELKSNYESAAKDLQLGNKAYYASLNGGDEQIYYSLNQINASILIENQSIRLDQTSSEGEQDLYLSVLDTFSLGGQEFEKVTQIEVLDTSKTEIEILWIKEKLGIIGFKLNQKIWFRK